MTSSAWGRRRAARTFVAAVTSGDIDRAEDSARHALCGNDAPDRTASSREHQLSWDEHVTVPRTWIEVATELREADGLARWCPTVRLIASDAEGDTIAVGRFLPVQLRLLSRRWSPRASGCAPTPAGRFSLGTSHFDRQPSATALKCGSMPRAPAAIGRDGPYGRRDVKPGEA